MRLVPAPRRSPMVPVPCLTTETVPPPSYQRALQKQPRALHRSALTLVTTLHLLDLCRLAVRLAQRRCPPPLPAGPGGAPRIYTEESLLVIALLRILWRLSYQDIHDWLCGVARPRACLRLALRPRRLAACAESEPAVQACPRPRCAAIRDALHPLGARRAPLRAESGPRSDHR